MFRWKIVCLNEVYKFSLRHFGTGCIFYVLIFNIKKIRFFSPKYDRALSKLNFLFHLISKRNWVTLRKCVIHIICNIIIKLIWALQYQIIINKLECMRRAQDRARSARSRKNGARSATIKSRALGALKLASEASCAWWECARFRFF